MEFVEVAGVNDLDDGQMVGFEVDDRRILLAKVEGEFFAIGATCTHERSNLDQGALLGHVVYCPLHYSAFDVRSGAVLGPPAECPVPAHEVRVEDGKVLVCTQPLDSAAPPPVESAASPPVESAASPPVESTAPPPVESPAPPPVDSAAPPPPDSQAPPTDSSTRARIEQLIAQIESNLTELRAIVLEGAPPPPDSAPPPPPSGTPAPDKTGVAEPAPNGGSQRAAIGASQPAPPPVDGAWSHQAPRFMGRIPTSARYLPLAIAIPGGLVALLVLTAAVWLDDGPAVPDGDILFEHFIGHGWLDVFALSLVGVAGLLAATGVRRFWKALQGTLPAGIPRRPLGEALRETARDVVSHEGFDGWTTSHVRRGAHLAMFYGFLGLLAVTSGAAIYTEIFPVLGIEWHDNELSLPIWDPVKIVGNVGGIALLVGLAQTLRTWPRPKGKSMYADWFFPGLLALTAVTGFVTEILRFAGVRMAYPAYAVHLVFVFGLFVFFPFSKFAHVIYHPAAQTFGRQIRRKPAPRLAPTTPPLDPDAAAV